MTHLAQTGWLFTDKTRTEDPDGAMSCPDVFELGGKVVILISTGGAWDLHPNMYSATFFNQLIYKDESHVQCLINQKWRDTSKINSA